MEIQRRHINASLKGFNEDENSAEFIISDATQDRHGTIIAHDKWSLSNYEKNPIVMYQHAGHYSDDPDNTIGRGEVRFEDDKLIGKVFFEPKDINEKADKIAQKVAFGTLRATSVGFMPLESGEWRTIKNEKGEDEDVYFYGKVDLLEWSIVNIPSNPSAVAKMIDEEKPELPDKKTEPKKEEKSNNLELFKKRLSLTQLIHNIQ